MKQELSAKSSLYKAYISNLHNITSHKKDIGKMDIIIHCKSDISTTVVIANHSNTYISLQT